jgi:small subunit ribosomal protein S2
MLTNFKTVKQSIKRLNELETMIADGSLDKLKKREALTVKRDHEKLVRSIGGIKEMSSLPDAIFVIDVGFESGAVEEATKLGIPVVGIVDSNNSIENISYVIPGNDDSSRAIRLYARGMADAVLAGKNQAITELAKSVSEETAEEE